MKTIIEKKSIIQKIFQECINDLTESKTHYPINYLHIEPLIEYMNRGNTLGYCKSRRGSNYFRIFLNKLMLDIVEKNEGVIRTVLMHELIHTFPLCGNHGKYFKSFAAKISKEFNMEIKTHANKEEEIAFSNEKVKKAPYIITCMACGKQICKSRKSRFIEEIYNNKKSLYSHLHCPNGKNMTSGKSPFIITRFEGEDIDLSESKNIFVAENVDKKLLSAFLKKFEIKIAADKTNKQITVSSNYKNDKKNYNSNEQLSLF